MLFFPTIAPLEFRNDDLASLIVLPEEGTKTSGLRVEWPAQALSPRMDQYIEERGESHHEITVSKADCQLAILSKWPRKG